MDRFKLDKQLTNWFIIARLIKQNFMFCVVPHYYPNVMNYFYYNIFLARQCTYA